MGRATIAASLVLALGVFAWAGEKPSKPKSGKPHAKRPHLTIAGIVKDDAGRPVPWAAVQWASKRQGRGHWMMTDQEGRFELGPFEAGIWRIDVTLYGVPDDTPRPSGEGLTPHKTVSIKAGTKDAEIVIALGQTLLVRAKGVHFGPGTRRTSDTITLYVGGKIGAYFDARLFVRSKTGLQSWIPTTRDGALVFRRIKPGLPWILHIPYSDDLGKTLYQTGKALETGTQTVELERGKPISGFVMGTRDTLRAGTYSGPPYNGLVARRGPVEVRIYPDLGSRSGQGVFRFPPLASGPWTVSVYNVERERRRVAASLETEAGAEIILSPQPSESAYRAARNHRR